MNFTPKAPSRWAASAASNSASDPHFSYQDPSSSGNNVPPVPHPALNRFLLPSGEYVSCVLWNGLYHITGTDIVRALVFRFDAFGRPVRNMKKFEEGVFSDLRNLKPGTDACLEEPKVSGSRLRASEINQQTTETRADAGCHFTDASSLLSLISCSSTNVSGRRRNRKCSIGTSLEPATTISLVSYMARSRADK